MLTSVHHSPRFRSLMRYPAYKDVVLEVWRPRTDVPCLSLVDLRLFIWRFKIAMIFLLFVVFVPFPIPNCCVLLLLGRKSNGHSLLRRYLPKFLFLLLLLTFPHPQGVCVWCCWWRFQSLSLDLYLDFCSLLPCIWIRMPPMELLTLPTVHVFFPVLIVLIFSSMPVFVWYFMPRQLFRLCIPMLCVKNNSLCLPTVIQFQHLMILE